MTTLETSLEAQSVPGSNLKDAVNGANWCFLLPRLELGRVLALGLPSASSLATLSGLSDQVAVWAKPEDHDRMRSLVAKLGLKNVTLLAAEHQSPLPVPDDAVDVLLVARSRLLRSPVGEVSTQAEIERVLKPNGLLYAESRSRLDRWRRRNGAKSPFGGVGDRGALWIAPASGEMRFAAPVRDRRAVEYLERRYLKSPLRRQLVKRPGRVLARSLLVNRLASRRALLVAGAGDELPPAPPAYVQEIAAGADAAVEGLRWALAAPGDYSSQKVLLFLFGDADEQPRSVVKITRDARHNARLENEWRALRLLRDRGIGGDGTRPSPLFFGHHAGLAVLGETALQGSPFLQRTQATAECPHAGEVVEWLLELGVATAHRPENASNAASRLEALLDRFRTLYRPNSSHERFLAEQVAAVTGSGDGLRLVFQHGDPGPWNLLVTPEGHPAFLDWEAADPDGMPLWDLFHFLRSFGLSISQKAGRRDPARSFADQVLGASGLNGLLVEATGRFLAETSLSPRLVEPLFHLCWVQRAVKEASRLQHDQLESGRYFSLLKLAIDRRQSPGLRRLFSLAAPV